MTGTKPMMPFPEAIKSCLGFGGRATRAEFWWWMLGVVTVSSILSILDGILFGFEDDIQIFSSLFGLVVLLPGLAVTARRLHDIGRSGWWQLVWIVAFLLGAIPFVIGGMASLGSMFFLSGGEGDFNMAAIVPFIIGLLISAAIWVGLVVLAIWWMVKQGQAGPNQHGPDPRALDS